MLSKPVTKNLLLFSLYFVVSWFWMFNLLTDSSKYFYVAYLGISLVGFYAVLSELENIGKEEDFL